MNYISKNFVYVRASHIDDRLYVVVVKGVEHGFSHLAKFYKVRCFKNFELMRYSRKRHSKRVSYVPNAKLGLKKRVENLNSRRVSYYREKLGKLKQMLVTRHRYFVLVLLVVFTSRLYYQIVTFKHNYLLKYLNSCSSVIISLALVLVNTQTKFQKNSPTAVGELSIKYYFS